MVDKLAGIKIPWGELSWQNSILSQIPKVTKYSEHVGLPTTWAYEYQVSRQSMNRPRTKCMPFVAGEMSTHLILSSRKATLQHKLNSCEPARHTQDQIPEHVSACVLTSIEPRS